MSTHIISRNGHYHFRLRTPSALLGILPQAEIIRSLKTTDLRTAKLTALPYLQGIQQTASLLRSNFITPEQAQNHLCGLLWGKGRAMPKKSVKAAQGGYEESVRLSCVIKSFLADKEKEWTPKTIMENTGVFRIIIDLMGDIPVESIDRGKVRDFREQLLKLPPNVYKVHPQDSPLAVLEMIDKGKLTATPMSITSVNKHISRLYSLMAYCIKEGYRSDNPASEMNVKQKRRQDEERKAYTMEDLQKIIKSLPQDYRTPERYWIPMICMYSGMRLDEACQLYREDIKKVDDVWCIDVNDSKDKKLKNLSSKRVIPVHPRLLELGFIDHVEGCDDGLRLWGNLTWCKVNGYSNSLGKWFQRFNRQHVTDDLLKTFHSLRHTFANTLKQLGEQESVIAELMGHANDSITTGRYGKRYQAEVLLEVVKKVDYGI